MWLHIDKLCSKKLLRKLNTKFNLFILTLSLSFMAGGFLFSAALAPTVASAEGFVQCGNANDGNIGSKCTLKDFFSTAARLVNYLFQGSAVVAVLGVVYGGFKMVYSRGNQAALGTAKKTVTYSVIGLVIILVAVLLVQTLINLLGLQGGEGIIQNPQDFMDSAGQGIGD